MLACWRFNPVTSSRRQSCDRRHSASLPAPPALRQLSLRSAGSSATSSRRPSLSPAVSAPVPIHPTSAQGQRDASGGARSRRCSLYATSLFPVSESGGVSQSATDSQRSSVYSYDNDDDGPLCMVLAASNRPTFAQMVAALEELRQQLNGGETTVNCTYCSSTISPAPLSKIAFQWLCI